MIRLGVQIRQGQLGFIVLVKKCSIKNCYGSGGENCTGRFCKAQVSAVLPRRDAKFSRQIPVQFGDFSGGHLNCFNAALP